MRNFIDKAIKAVRKFFYGRNGLDDIARLAFVAYIVSFLVYGFCPQGIVKLIFLTISYALLAYTLFRILSKSVHKRMNENRRYLGWKKMTKTRWQQRKTHKFYRCPKCKAWLRVPRGKGKITLTCVKCGEKFDKRT